MTVTSVTSDADKPRVISEVKKNSFHNKRRLVLSNSLEDDGRPKIAGELLWNATPTQWHVKLAEVRHGSLIVYCCSTGAAEFRLPLHHLNIQAGHTPRTFTLVTSHGIPLATFQTFTEEEYQRWVRILAVEVLRQTPIQDVRFLDILGITQREEGLRRGRSEECLTSAVKPETQRQRNKHNFREKKKKEKSEFSQWLHCVKRENEDNKNTEFDMKNMKIRRAQRIRPKLPFADTWNKLRGYADSKNVSQIRNKSISMDNLYRQPIETPHCNCIGDKKPESDESGISSGDENNNTLSETSIKCQAQPESAYVSVREKKRFFESLSESEPKRPDVNLNRSNSISNIDVGAQQQQQQQHGMIRYGIRASSMHDLTGNAVAVKQMRRLFETGSISDLSKSFDDLSFDRQTILEEDENEEKNQIPNFVNPVERKPKSVSYANVQVFRTTGTESKTVRFSENTKKPATTQNTGPDSSQNTTVLNQRKLQRGERKLGKLRIQIAEVEETIKNIADDLQSIGPDTLKRRSGLEVFAALRRRLEEESSRLERLQEETAKVISDNQRTILKMGSSRVPGGPIKKGFNV